MFDKLQSLPLWPLHIPSIFLPYSKPKLVPSSDPAQHDQTQLEGNGEPSCVENEKNNHKLKIILVNNIHWQHNTNNIIIVCG